MSQFPQVFKAGCGPAFTPMFQDALRKHMIDHAPKLRRTREATAESNRAKSENAAKRREEMRPFIVSMYRRGMTKVGIAQELGVSDFYVSRVLKEAAQ